MSTWKDADDLKGLGNDEVKEYNDYRQAHLEEWRREKSDFYCWS